MTCLLDTHFLLWLVLNTARLSDFPWLDQYRPWGVSPVSLLELRFLAEVGRLELDAPGFMDTLLGDDRFIVDEVPLLGLVRHALALEWTRDPFDRLLAAHSSARRVPLVTVDRGLLLHHRDIVEPLRPVSA